MADRLLLWQRTDLPSKPRDDYLGRDLDRQRLYARVYRAAGGTGTGEWFRTLWRRSTKRARSSVNPIASGTAADPAKSARTRAIFAAAEFATNPAPAKAVFVAF